MTLILYVFSFAIFASFSLVILVSSEYFSVPSIFVLFPIFIVSAATVTFPFIVELMVTSSPAIYAVPDISDSTFISSPVTYKSLICDDVISMSAPAIKASFVFTLSSLMLFPAMNK